MKMPDYVRELMGLPEPGDTKEWDYIYPFLSKSDADTLYKKMMKQSWYTDHSDQDGKDSSSVYFGKSFQAGGGKREQEISTIPDFLMEIGEKVSKKANAPFNYVQCHRFGPESFVRPHRDPPGE